MTLDDLQSLSAAELRELLTAGHPVDLDAIADRQMNGVSLAPGLIRHTVAWTKFQKTFKRREDGGLRGWNVACEQNPLDQPWIHKQRRGQPHTYWHYTVLPREDGPGLLIDYPSGRNRRLDFMNVVRDPLVAVNEDDSELLLGISRGPAGVALPFTWFALAGGSPLDHDAQPPRAG